ncbi:MAG TPA: class II aldolase/adducin family protein [Pseudolabrys sp.]|nr:class II aldolase/adducin family protein [Pseudolabrys sp.]
MAPSLTEALHELALANRIAANEGVLDTFGHISMRHPNNPNRYFLSRSSSPDMVAAERLIEYDLDSNPVRDPGAPQYSERVIHGEIYKARPDVMAVCHHHSPSFMPLIAVGADYIPVFHLGAAGGIKPPYWDQHDEFGDTNMLVIKPEEGASLAKALGEHPMVLMRRHGVTVIGATVRECVFRAVQTCRNADYQVRAMAIGGHIASLTPGETERCGDVIGKTTGVTRSWDSWALRIARADGAGAPAKAAKPAKPAAKSATKPAARRPVRAVSGKKKRR